MLCVFDFGNGVSTGIGLRYAFCVRLCACAACCKCQKCCSNRVLVELSSPCLFLFLVPMLQRDADAGDSEAAGAGSHWNR